MPGRHAEQGGVAVKGHRVTQSTVEGFVACGLITAASIDHQFGGVGCTRRSQRAPSGGRLTEEQGTAARVIGTGCADQQRVSRVSDVFHEIGKRGGPKYSRFRDRKASGLRLQLEDVKHGPRAQRQGQISTRERPRCRRRHVVGRSDPHTHRIERIAASAKMNGVVQRRTVVMTEEHGVVCRRDKVTRLLIGLTSPKIRPQRGRWIPSIRTHLEETDVAYIGEGTEIRQRQRQGKLNRTRPRVRCLKPHQLSFAEFVQSDPIRRDPTMVGAKQVARSVLPPRTFAEKMDRAVVGRFVKDRMRGRKRHEIIHDRDVS